MIAMWCIFDKFDKFIFLALHLFYFRYKLYIAFKNMPCELMEFTRRIALFQFFEDIICRHTG